MEYSIHPYNRNNGSMIPNRGYQHIVSTGFYLEFGPLSVQFKQNITSVKIKALMDFGMDIILRFGQNDIGFGID